jgi:DNA-binding response OmpR family regulator
LELKKDVRVLLVEDDLSVASGIAALLALHGCSVTVVHSGREALPAAEAFSPEVVVLDVHLPDLGGDRVFRDLRSRWPDLPVVFSSGHVHQLADITEGEPSRVLLLRKPYDGEQLVEAIVSVTR